MTDETVKQEWRKRRIVTRFPEDYAGCDWEIITNTKNVRVIALCVEESDADAILTYKAKAEMAERLAEVLQGVLRTDDSQFRLSDDSWTIFRTEARGLLSDFRALSHI